jgi:EAL domain-containing protein (putative c-di-GMP-specific phosphodiesterase class I)/GGDEF domain-containing protein
MIFSLNLLLSVNNIRSYLEGESQIHAQDTATSLGLSLSSYMVEETDPIIETTMNAIFDMGYYQEIKLVNVENQPLITLTNKKKFEAVPDWFVETISMKTAMAKSEISTGWSISGVIYVTINPGYAYLKLYEQARSSLYYSLAAFVLSIALLWIVLRFTLFSLKKVDQMALNIADGRFETIEQLPWTTEVRNVTASMNIMSRKIEGAIRNLNTKLDSIGKKLQLDDLTGLYKKSSFETDMKSIFSTDDIEVFIFMIKVDSLASLVKELDNDTIDQFLKDFARVLTDVSEQCVDAEMTAYRFFGSEFVLLAKQVNYKKTEEIAKILSSSLAELGEKYNKPDIAHIGVAPFHHVDTTDDFLLAANEAYEQARLIGVNSYYIRTCENRAKDIAEWKSLVFDIVDNRDYKVLFVRQVESFQTEQLLMEEAFTQAVDKKGNLISIGIFIAIAEKFEKIVDLDKGVTSQVVEYIKSRQIQHAVAINLSTRTIKNSEFRSWLVHLIKQNPFISKQLVFSISAYAVAKETGVYKEFIDFVHGLNAKVIIKRFETQSMSPEVAKELNPDFIRLARDIGNGIATDAGKKAFVETMQEIAELLDISVLAENVHAENDFTCVKAIGIAGASR